MRLTQVANKFNTMPVVDAYNPSIKFMAQFDPMSFSKIDGVSVRKRTISIAPSIQVPPRGCVSIDGQVYLTSTPAPDYWKGSVIRKTVVIQGTDGLAELRSIAGALRNDAPVTAHTALSFSRYLPEAADSSKYPPQYQLFLAGSESAPAESLIKLGTDWYLVKESYLSTSGLRIVMANVLAGPVFETINYTSKTYVPTTDSYSSVVTQVKILRVKWQEHFNYLTKADESYQRGDIQVVLLKSAAPGAKASDTLNLSDGDWRILSVQDEGETLSLHMRRT